ncbi:MAG: phytanoyl-CoA dioxygenase family protein [Chlamydiales bacterium]|nr:phytanoyl-CoA dioxygenase family protein [Chlamydiales bacterium]
MEQSVSISIKENEEMQRNGFMIIPFPDELSTSMVSHIKSFVQGSVHDKEEVMDHETSLTDLVTMLSDEEFVKRYSKPQRMFPEQVTKKAIAWVEGLASFLGGSRAGVNFVSEDEYTQNAKLNRYSYDVFWRCVRPRKADIGAPHCDYQFWELAKGTKAEPIVPFEYKERWKIWVPLLGCNSQNSLHVIPGSHLEDVPIDYISTKNGIKPDIQEEWLKQNSYKFVCPLDKFQDCCILFHDKLVHKGTPNHGQELRISGELTILLQQLEA